MSASKAAAIDPRADESEGRSEIGAQDLAQGLMLVRASTINVVRLQLAMERRDRRTALQTLDELTLLDRRIGDLLDDLHVDPAQAWPDVRRLEHQHRALAAEKLVLAAGASGPDVTAISGDWIEPPRPASEPIAVEPQSRDLSPHLIAAALLLLILAGAAAFLFLTDSGQALLAWAASPEGAPS